MRWRSPITLAVLVVILLGAAYYGWQTVVNPATSSDGAVQTPTTTTKHTAKPKKVCVSKQTYPKGLVTRASSFKVNVFNAGGVSGQAAEVLAQLHGRGFQSGVAANPPSGVTTKNVAILTNSPESPRARLVAEQFKGDVKLVPGPALASGVVVVIGSKFAGMADHAPFELTLKHAVTVCTKYKLK